LSCAHKTRTRTSRGDHMPKLRQKDAGVTEKTKGEPQATNELTAGKKRYVKRVLSDARPTIWIGRSGASEDLLKEIAKQLEKNKMVKVKILKSGLAGHEAKQIASEIAEQTASSLVETRGHTFMLYKRRNK
jgi:RNA-binding protein